MEVIKPGHEYMLANVGGGTQKLNFVEGIGEGRMLEGTTTEEVLNVLIDRVTFLNGTLPSSHNEDAIKSLQVALASLEARTADRVERGVEGTNAA